MEYEFLKKNLIGIYAYDNGSVGSGIRNESLRAEIGEYLRSLSDSDQRIIISRILRDSFLTEEALEMDYGWEDAREFIDWIDDDSLCRLWGED